MTIALDASMAAAAPKWCENENIAKRNFINDVKGATGDDPQRAVRSIVAATCFPDNDDKKAAAAIAKAKEQWSKALDLSDDEWLDVALWGSGEPSDFQSAHNAKLDYSKKYALSALDPIEQYAGITNGFPSLTGRGPEGTGDYVYPADALGPKLTELGRLGVIEHCADTYRPNAVVFAMCQAELDLFDKKKAFAEIRASKNASPDHRIKMKLVLDGLDANTAPFKTAVKALLAKDPAYVKMFEIAKQTRKEWDSIWTTNAPLVDLALTMDDARMTASRKAKEGCDAKVWSAWEAVVTKIPAKSFEGFAQDASWSKPAMAVVISTPEGFLASVALYHCLEGTKDAVANELGSLLAFYPGLRGPRTATYLAIQNAGLKLDDASANIDYPGTDRRGIFGQSGGGGPLGTIGKITKDGKGSATVAFAKKSEKQDNCVSSKALNRISYVRSDGGVVYQTVCLKWQTVTIDTTRDPEVVAERYVNGLKPGMNAYVGSGAVWSAFAKGKKSPSFVAGVAVK